MGRGKALSVFEVQEILRLNAIGEEARDIAAFLGRSPASIYKVLRGWMCGRLGRKPLLTKLDVEKVYLAAAKKQHATGKHQTLQMMAQKLGVSSRTLSRYFQKHGAKQLRLKKRCVLNPDHIQARKKWAFDNADKDSAEPPHFFLPNFVPGYILFGWK